MSEERTEAATPKRRQEARDRGQVARSVELQNAVALLAGFMLFQSAGGAFLENLGALVQKSLTNISTRDLTEIDVQNLITGVGLQTLALLLPILLSLAAIGVLVGILQVGFGFSAKAMTPDFSRMNPLTGMKRFVSPNSALELVKSLLKLGIVGVVAYGVLQAHLVPMTMHLGNSPAAAFGEITSIGVELALKCSAVFLALSAIDYGYQRWQFERSIRMTKQEIKEESKQQEGNPEIKGRQRRLQRQAAMRRMMNKVPTADVVVTNPTHYAVALKYDNTSGGAPVVVAKGVDVIAQQIKKIAAENNVPTVENVPLARALYAAVELDEEIPMDLYQAVAEVLAFVFKMRRGL